MSTVVEEVEVTTEVDPVSKKKTMKKLTKKQRRRVKLLSKKERRMLLEQLAQQERLNKKQRKLLKKQEKMRAKLKKKSKKSKGILRRAGRSFKRTMKKIGRGLKKGAKKIGRGALRAVGYLGRATGWVFLTLVTALALALMGASIVVIAIGMLIGFGVAGLVAWIGDMYNDYIQGTFHWMSRPKKQRQLSLGKFRSKRNKKIAKKVDNSVGKEIEKKADKKAQKYAQRLIEFLEENDVVLNPEEIEKYRWAAGVGVPAKESLPEDDPINITVKTKEEIAESVAVDPVAPAVTVRDSYIEDGPEVSPWEFLKKGETVDSYTEQMRELYEAATSHDPQEYSGGTYHIVYDEMEREVPSANMAEPDNEILKAVVKSGQHPQFFDFSWVNDYPKLMDAFEYYSNILPDPRGRAFFVGRAYLFDKWLHKHKKDTRGMRDQLNYHLAMMHNKYINRQSELSIPWMRAGFQKQAEELLAKSKVPL